MAGTRERFKYLPVDRSRLRYWLLVSALFFARVELVPFVLGTVLLLVGMCVHLWAKGTLLQNKILAQTGPYRWIRHPFYLSNALIDLGFCCMINRPEVLAVFSLFWIIGYARAIVREEEKLSRVFGAEFKAYRERTPALIPWKRPAANLSTAGFSWQNPNLATGSELPRLVRLAGYPFLIFAASEFHETGIRFWTELGGGFVALWVFLFLSCAGFILKRALQEKFLIFPAWSTSNFIRNAFVLCILAFASSFPFLELEMGPREFGIGGLLVCGIYLHLFICRRTTKPAVALLSEGAILIVLCFVAELPWLSLCPMSYYSGLWLNAFATGTVTLPYNLTPHGNIRLAAILTLGFGLMLWKEIFDDSSGLLPVLQLSTGL